MTLVRRQGIKNSIFLNIGVFLMGRYPETMMDASDAWGLTEGQCFGKHLDAFVILHVGTRAHNPRFLHATLIWLDGTLETT